MPDKDDIWRSWVQEQDHRPTWETVFWVLAGWMVTILLFGYLLANNT